MSRPPALRHDMAREEAELRAYLGDAYEPRRLEQSEALLDAEVAEVGDEHALYRTSQAYLYNLTAFAMSGLKLPYLGAFTRLVAPGSRVLDYGCGIGSDGLMLLEAGYRVEFADFANPSTEYLRWRLTHRGLEAPVHDLDRDVPGGFDAAYSLDVIEHVPDAHAFLDELERRAALVAVNLLEYEPHEQPLHYELPIGEILRRASRGRLRHYRVFHRTAHFVMYEPGRATAVQQGVGRLRLLAGGVRRRVA